jgi:hypothetical protein
MTIVSPSMRALDQYYLQSRPASLAGSPLCVKQRQRQSSDSVLLAPTYLPRGAGNGMSMSSIRLLLSLEIPTIMNSKGSEPVLAKELISFS